MRRFIFAACVLALTAAPAIAGDGQVPQNSLTKMGLSGMKVMPDQEGMRVRGTSIAFTFAVATGTPIVSVNSPFDVGNHFAFSARVGVSGNTIAGGFAVASAH
jgi:hypothetical protein